MKRLIGGSIVLLLAGLGTATLSSAPTRATVVTNSDADAIGTTETAAPNNAFSQQTGPFFKDFGTLGRFGCEECHVERLGWSVTATAASGLPASDPLFVFDGSDCLPPGVPNTSASNSIEMRNFGNTRIELGIPQGADFGLAGSSDPFACPTAPTASNLRMYRRPLPVANASFIANVMWDGREEVTPTIFGDLKHQANTAELIHAQATSSISDADQTSIASFQTNLFAAQVKIGNLKLDARGGNGGAVFLMTAVAPAFSLGMNDPSKPGFNPAVFTIYQSWEPGRTPSNAQAAAIGRGEVVFNTKLIRIASVPGLNGPHDASTAPISGFCGSCHNTPNVGSHSTSLFVDIGVTSPSPTLGNLDVGHLPIYWFMETTTGNTTVVTDPGRGLVTGKFIDIGKTKVPGLRNLAARPPYFHNGSAPDLTTVIDYHDRRFSIGFSAQEKSDLVAFLQAL